MTETVAGHSAGDESRPPTVLVLHSTPEGLGVQKQVSTKNPVMTQLYRENAPLRVRIEEKFIGRHYIYPQGRDAELRLMEDLELSPKALRTCFGNPNWFRVLLQGRFAEVLHKINPAFATPEWMSSVKVVVIEENMIEDSSWLTHEVLQGVFSNAEFYSFLHASNQPRPIWKEEQRTTGDGVVLPRCMSCGGETRFTGKFFVCKRCGELSTAK